MRHESLSTQEQRLVEEYLEKFSAKTKKFLKNRWPYRVEEAHFDSAIHDTAMQLARQSPTGTTASTFQLVANRRLVDILRENKILHDLRRNPPPIFYQLDQLDPKLMTAIAVETYDFVQNLLESDLANEIRNFLERQREAGEIWADIFYLYFIKGLEYKQITSQAGYSSATITKALLKDGPAILRLRFAASA